MIILAIQDGHNSSASLMINGRIILLFKRKDFVKLKLHRLSLSKYQTLFELFKKKKLKLDWEV